MFIRNKLKTCLWEFVFENNLIFNIYQYKFTIRKVSQEIFLTLLGMLLFRFEPIQEISKRLIITGNFIFILSKNVLA